MSNLRYAEAFKVHGPGDNVDFVTFCRRTARLFAAESVILPHFVFRVFESSGSPVDSFLARPHPSIYVNIPLRCAEERVTVVGTTRVVVHTFVAC